MSNWVEGSPGHAEGPMTGPAPASGRRSFLNWLLGGWVTAFVVSVVYPVYRYIIPPRATGPATTNVTLPLRASEVKLNSGTIFKFGQKPGILIRTQQGDYKAFSGTCTHLDCTVQYKSDSQQIWCACHNGFYDLRGRNVAGPPPRPLEEFQVNLRGDEIIVSKMG